MDRTIARPLAAVTLLALALVALAAAGCSLTSVSGSEGDKGVNVSMGGKMMTTDMLDFTVTSCSASSITIKNRATAHALELGIGTPIVTGAGQTVSETTNYISIPPGSSGTVGISAPLQVGGTYYLGAGPNGGKPTIRQMFMNPGDTTGGGGGGGYNIPAIPGGGATDVPE